MLICYLDSLSNFQVVLKDTGIFSCIRDEKAAYKDNTQAIAILEEQRTKAHILLRPRCFGKTTFLTMLQAFYDINKLESFDKSFKVVVFFLLPLFFSPTLAVQFNAVLLILFFQGTAIYESHNMIPHNKYMIISLDFSTASTEKDCRSVSEILNEAINTQLCQTYLQYPNLLPFPPQQDFFITRKATANLEWLLADIAKAGKQVSSGYL